QISKPVCCRFENFAVNSRPIIIGNAQGFWGDSVDAPARLVSQQADLDYLTLDYLAEMSMSILASQKERNPTAGYARDFVEVVRSLVRFWQRGSRVRVISNAGGLNPHGCAKACAEVLRQAGINSMRIGVVTGDDVFPLLQTAGAKANRPNLFANLETGESLTKVLGSFVTASAYLGAQ